MNAERGMDPSQGCRTRRLGVHTSIAGGIHRSVERAAALKCNTLQIFSHNPRTWLSREVSPEEASRFRELAAHHDMRPIFIHASYLINLSSPDEETRKKSVDLLAYELRTARTLGADHVVLHPGKAVGRELKEALRKAAEALSQAYAEAEVQAVGVLLENTAGQRGDISSTIPLLAEIIDNTPPGCVKGLCLDTCHAYASGYDITAPEGLERLNDEIARYISPLKVELVHLNDSKRGPASGIDRHEHIGRGRIGIEGLWRFLSSPFFPEAPLILETPKESEEDDGKNLDRVRELLALKRRQPNVDDIQIPT